MQNKNPRENKKKKEGFAKLTGHKQVTNIYSNRELELFLASAASILQVTLKVKNERLSKPGNSRYFKSARTGRPEAEIPPSLNCQTQS